MSDKRLGQNAHLLEEALKIFLKNKCRVDTGNQCYEDDVLYCTPLGEEDILAEEIDEESPLYLLRIMEAFPRYPNYAHVPSREQQGVLFAMSKENTVRFKKSDDTFVAVCGYFLAFVNMATYLYRYFGRNKKCFDIKLKHILFAVVSHEYKQMISRRGQNRFAYYFDVLARYGAEGGSSFSFKPYNKNSVKTEKTGYVKSLISQIESGKQDIESCYLSGCLWLLIGRLPDKWNDNKPTPFLSIAGTVSKNDMANTPNDNGLSGEGTEPIPADGGKLQYTYYILIDLNF